MNVNFNAPDINGIKDDPDFAKGMNSAGYGMGKDPVSYTHLTAARTGPWT